MGILWGEVIVDIAVINGNLYAYEIKSEADNLARLPSQINAYDKVFDFSTIVIHEKHYSKFEGEFRKITTKWGIAVVSGSNDNMQITIEQEALRNEADPLSVCSLLWRSEALEILKKYDLSKGLLSKTKKVLYSALAKNLDPALLKGEIRQTLKHRVGWRAD